MKKIIKKGLIVFMFLNLITLSSQPYQDCFSSFNSCSFDAEASALLPITIFELTPEQEKKAVEKYITLMRACVNDYFGCTY